MSATRTAVPKRMASCDANGRRLDTLPAAILLPLIAAKAPTVAKLETSDRRSNKKFNATSSPAAVVDDQFVGHIGAPAPRRWRSCDGATSNSSCSARLCSGVRTPNGTFMGAAFSTGELMLMPSCDCGSALTAL